MEVVMDLIECREKIDQIDREIVKLFEERMRIAENVAEYKRNTGDQVLDTERERQKREALKKLAANPFNERAIDALFTQIMSISRKLQYSLLQRGIYEKDFKKIAMIPKDTSVRVVYFGEHASYTEQAMEECFGEKVQSFQAPSFREVMMTIQEGGADYGVLPIENSTTGGISDIYDLLVEFNHFIVGEHIVRVEHALMGLEHANLEEITKVYSHPQAILQSRKFLDEHLYMRSLEGGSTATSAKKVKEDADKTQAAIASPRAAAYYGLKILAEHINYEMTNSTRFILISKKPEYLHDSNRISICFSLPHETGSLYHILSHVACNDLNMSRIESRPLPGRPFEYRFFVDFDGNMEDAGVRNVLDGMKMETQDLKILGTYKIII